MGDKTATLSFYATITIPIGLFSNMSAKVTLVILPFFCRLGCVVQRQTNNCFSHEERSWKALIPLFPGASSLQWRTVGETGLNPGQSPGNVSSQTSVQVAGLSEPKAVCQRQHLPLYHIKPDTLLFAGLSDIIMLTKISKRLNVLISRRVYRQLLIMLHGGSLLRVRSFWHDQTHEPFMGIEILTNWKIFQPHTRRLCSFASISFFFFEKFQMFERLWTTADGWMDG